MASLEKRESGYVVRWRVDGGSRQRTFKGHKEALAHKTQVESDAAAGRAVDPAHGRITFEEWWKVWTAGRVNLRSSTLAQSASAARTHTLPVWGSKRLDSIRQPQVQAWVNKLAGSGLAPATVHAAYKDFQQAMSAAVTAKMLRDSPCVGITLPKVERSEMNFLDHADIRALADAIEPRYRALIFLLAYGGLRIGEAAALKPAQVDFKNGTVTVIASAAEVSGHVQINPPKSKAGRRTIYLTSSIMDELARHMEEFPGREYVFEGAQGGILRSRAWSQRYYKTALAKAGLSKVRVHDLRHTAISMWVRAGVDLVRIKTWAGHSSSTFTVDRYGHLYVTDNAAILETLDANILRDAVLEPS